MTNKDLRDPEEFVTRILGVVLHADTERESTVHRLLDLVRERDRLLDPPQENRVIWFALRGPLMCKPRHWKLQCGCAGYGDRVTAWCPSNSNGKAHFFDFAWGYTQEMAWEPIEESGA